MIKIVVCICLLTSAFIVKPGTQEKKKIMAIFAHPDDELTVSHLLSLYSRKGHVVKLVIATKGEKGTTKHAKIPGGDSLANVRAREAACACKTLGIDPPVLLGLNDGELDVDFTGAPLRRKLDSVIKLYEPDIVITWGPEGGYGHLDHRMVHNVVTEIFQSGKLHKPSQLYYTGFPTENFTPVPTFNTSLASFFFNSWKPVQRKYLTTRIKCEKQDIEKARKALACHASQFSKEQSDDVSILLDKLNRDTAYLRPFLPEKAVSNTLLPKGK